MGNGDGPARHPAAVPDEGVDERTYVLGGVDTDGDGRPDTLLVVDGPDLLVRTDLDGDGLADRTLWIGPDGSVRDTTVEHLDELGWPGPDP